MSDGGPHVGVASSRSRVNKTRVDRRECVFNYFYLYHSFSLSLSLSLSLSSSFTYTRAYVAYMHTRLCTAVYAEELFTIG